MYLLMTDMGETTEHINLVWDEMNIREDILRGIYSYGYDKPSEIQRNSIPVIMSGRDTIAQAQSGMGKTGSFSIGTLHRIDVQQQCTQALLLAPTHELAKQTANVVNALGSCIEGLRTMVLIGGQAVQDDIAQIRKAPPHVVIGTTGRVYDMLQRRHLNGADIKLIVLDEADEMLSKGFKNQIYNIFQICSSSAQVALFSATLPPDILELTSKFMRDPVNITMIPEKLTLAGIQQYYIAVNDDRMKFDVLKDLFSSISVTQCIIYCNSVNRVSDLHKAMADEGFSVGCIHSSQDRTARAEEFAKFRSGAYRVLISSNVTARGIDVQKVSTVINFDMPKDPHTYLHRIGRSGRWGRKGMAINFVTRHDIFITKKLESYYKINIDELPSSFADNIM